MSCKLVQEVSVMYLTSVRDLATRLFLGPQSLQVAVSLAQHPDRERELEVWV